jgi:hypothetical protein
LPSARNLSKIISKSFKNNDCYIFRFSQISLRSKCHYKKQGGQIDRLAKTFELWD